MKTQKIQLNIQKPCSENWENMTQNNMGKFCDKCAKNVIDFSNMSDTQIIHYFQNSLGNICGRLKENQLNRELIPIPEIPNRTLIYKFLASVFLLGLTHKLFSKYSLNISNFNPKINTKSIEINSDKISINDTNKRRISGRVIPPNSKEKTQYIAIQLTGTELKTLTDSNGYFSMIIPNSLLKDTMNFYIDHVYYKTEYFQKNKSNLQEFIEIKLSRNEYGIVAKARPPMVSGGMILEKIPNSEIRKQNFFNRTYHQIKRLFNKKDKNLE